jgi:hypothetical protein
MKVHTFIGRLIRHIPDKHFPMIRYAGVVIPATYKNNHGETMKIDPNSLDPNTEVVRY